MSDCACKTTANQASSPAPTLVGVAGQVAAIHRDLQQIVGAPLVPVQVIAAQVKAEINAVAVAALPAGSPSPFRRGRFTVAGESAVGEPLIGLAEGEGVADAVACCGGCDPAAGGAPTQLAFERASRDADGVLFQPLHQVELPKGLAAQYAKKENRSCLPWVRVARDPERFRACLAQARAIGSMDDPKKVYKLVRDFMVQQDQEVFLAILLDTQLQVRGISEIVRGSRDGVGVPVPDVLRIVLVDGARSFIVAHNHPSGLNVQPSESDIDLTKTVAKAARAVKVSLFDHVICGAHKYYSFAQDPKHRNLVRV